MKIIINQHFQATIKDGCSLGVFISIPSDLDEKLDKKRIKIQGSIDGINFTGVISFVIPFGKIIVLKKNLLLCLDKTVGEEVEVKFNTI